MGKLLALLLGLVVVGGVAWYVVRNHAPDADPGNLEGKSAPKQTLDNVRKAADGVEADMKRRAEEDDRMQKAAAQ